MTGALFDLGLRLRAREMGRPVRCASTAHHVIRPDAVLVSVVGMGGERTGLWAVAYGPLQDRQSGQPNEPLMYDAVNHPFYEEDQDKLLKKLSNFFMKNPSVAAAADGNSFPQLVVADAATRELLLDVAERHRNSRDEKVKQLAATLLFFVDRLPVAGQQAIITLTEAFNARWRIGMEPAGEQHFGTLAAVHLNRPLPPQPPEGNEAMMDRADENKLVRPVFDWMNLRRDGVGAAAASAAGFALKEILPEVKNLVKARWVNHREAALYLCSDQVDPLPFVAGDGAGDGRAWQAWKKNMVRKSEEGTISWHSFTQVPRSPTVAARSVYLKERASQVWATTLLHQDELVRLRAVADGEVIVGRTEPHDSGVAVVTDQDLLQVRPGDDMVLLGDPGTLWEVVEVVDAKGFTKVVFATGETNVPVPGTDVTLLPPIPDFRSPPAPGKVWTHHVDVDVPRRQRSVSGADLLMSALAARGGGS